MAPPKSATRRNLRRNAIARVLNAELPYHTEQLSNETPEGLRATANNTKRKADDEPLWDSEIDACGVQANAAALVDGLTAVDKDLIRHPHHHKRRDIGDGKDRPSGIRPRKARDFFASLAEAPELLMELAHHLPMPDLISLYAISKDFHETVNGHMSHIMKSCAAYTAPEASRVFKFNLYNSLCIDDPVGRFQKESEVVRRVPGLCWLQMVTHRQKTIRDILACMAREGHRMPKTMAMTLNKMWLTMDMATSARRCQFMHNEEYWTDNDIYNVQLFMIKLEMRFNDPIDGPADDGLKKLMLGQRGLTPLAKLLKRTAYTRPLELVQCAIRYAYTPRPEHMGMAILGVPASEVGRGHLEGWGQGRVHLYRMDEIIPREAVRRNLALDKHMMSMLLWGYVDPVTKMNIAVNPEEIYMSDDDNNPTMPVPVDSGDVPMLDVDGEAWETDDEDMPDESIDDVADSGAIGSSGYRRDRDDDQV